jgi:nitroimidazol reductase NimA-like FMN-containing flavoprotein (pyridoxamine 5'-phosphate oxidase superfamily)
VLLGIETVAAAVTSYPMSEESGRMNVRPVRRTDREISLHEAQELLSKGEYGVLSTVGKDGQPYGVPLSYAYRNNCLYFHCAIDGHKLENIESNPRVSFCVVGKTRVLPEKFATEYESAVAYGVASEVYGAERQSALMWLLEKYSPGYIEEGNKYIDEKNHATKVVKLAIGHMTGKARRQ